MATKPSDEFKIRVQISASTVNEYHLGTNSRTNRDMRERFACELNADHLSLSVTGTSTESKQSFTMTVLSVPRCGSRNALFLLLVPQPLEAVVWTPGSETSSRKHRLPMAEFLSSL